MHPSSTPSVSGVGTLRIWQYSVVLLLQFVRLVSGARSVACKHIWTKRHLRMPLRTLPLVCPGYPFACALSRDFRVRVCALLSGSVGSGCRRRQPAGSDTAVCDFVRLLSCLTLHWGHFVLPDTRHHVHWGVVWRLASACLCSFLLSRGTRPIDAAAQHPSVALSASRLCAC